MGGQNNNFVNIEKNLMKVFKKKQNSVSKQKKKIGDLFKDTNFLINSRDIQF